MDKKELESIRHSAMMADLICSNAVLRLLAYVEELELRVDEECRLNGMGGSRELKLMTRVNNLKKALEDVDLMIAQAYISNWSEESLCKLIYDVPNVIRKALEE